MRVPPSGPKGVDPVTERMIDQHILKPDGSIDWSKTDLEKEIERLEARKHELERDLIDQETEDQDKVRVEALREEVAELEAEVGREKEEKNES